MNLQLRRLARGVGTALILGASVLAACGRSSDQAAAPPAAPAPAASVVPAASLPSDAYLVLPGDYAQSTTVAELEARFGKSNVRQQTTPEPRLVLYPDDPTRRAYLAFHEPEAFEELALISVVDAGSRWRSG